MLSLSLPRRHALAAAGLLLVGLVVAGKLLLGAGAPEAPVYALATAPAAPASPPPAPVVVDVVGSVRRPGLYRLPQGARIADALARAGGAGRHADLALVNLAAPLSDGQQIIVPARGAAVPAGAAPAAPGAPAGPVHLNSATEPELDALPGVGPVTAQKILDYRQQHGLFTSVEELDAIPGIGPARIDQLRALVTP